MYTFSFNFIETHARVCQSQRTHLPLLATTPEMFADFIRFASIPAFFQIVNEVFSRDGQKQFTVGCKKICLQKAFLFMAFSSDLSCTHILSYWNSILICTVAIILIKLRHCCALNTSNIFFWYPNSEADLLKIPKS